MGELPLIKRLPYIDPIELAGKFCGRDKFLLHSALQDDIGRYSFAGSDPFLVLEAKGRQVTITQDGKKTTVTGSPMTEIRALLKRYQRPLTASVPFTGGAVGFFAYDAGWLFEELPQQAEDDLELPDIYLPFYDRIAAVDHINKETLLFSHGYPFVGKAGKEWAQKRMAEMEQMLTASKAKAVSAQRAVAAGPPCSNFNGQKYMDMVQRGKEYIAAGDIFQVNLSQRFKAPLYISPWELYQRLTKVNPAPFAAYFDFAPAAIISASPERYLRLKGDWVETRPIKGTRPRGNTTEQDNQLRQELFNSAKDRAELVMIVDLERNDLGRVCRIGSVKVPEVFTLRAYATVFHLVSTVEGRLNAGADICDLLEATFPGGSITGAPKIRAMEIIEEQEPTKRSVYTGSMGYIDFSGDADLNIVIRTFLVKEGMAYFQVGGGIVADSQPEAEYQETLDKAKALLASLGSGADA